MLDNEKLGIAAHLCVLMRRKLGRVIDAEWLVANRDYGIEVVRLARASPHPDLHEWAAKLEAWLPAPAIRGDAYASRATADATASAVLLADDETSQPPMEAGVVKSQKLQQDRYVGRLR
jgi:hypothetical protein